MLNNYLSYIQEEWTDSNTQTASRLFRSGALIAAMLIWRKQYRKKYEEALAKCDKIDGYFAKQKCEKEAVAAYKKKKEELDKKEKKAKESKK